MHSHSGGSGRGQSRLPAHRDLQQVRRFVLGVFVDDDAVVTVAGDSVVVVVAAAVVVASATACFFEKYLPVVTPHNFSNIKLLKLIE